MSRLRTFVLAAALVAAVTGTASAQSRIQAGVLECLGLGTTGFIIGSVHDLECVFRSDYGIAVRYHGVVRKFGLDLGYTEHSGLTWAVFAPTRQIGPGDLAGYYVGVSAGAAIGLGLCQCAGRRLEQFLRAAAPERRGPIGYQSCDRRRRPGAALRPLSEPAVALQS
jgi:hypothetical protein